MSNEAILEVRNLVTKFDTLEGMVNAVSGVSFDLQEGETLAIVGESGSGKTVTMLSLLGLIPVPPGKVEEGEAFLNAFGERRDLLKMSPGELRQVRGGAIGFVFQDPISSLNPVLTIGEQISETLMKHVGMSRPQAAKRTRDLLVRVSIPDPGQRLNSYPHQFSGGMRQRVMIAIAIACTPQIVIADEPTTALDVTVQAQIVDLFKRLRDELGVAVIWITHDLGVVAGLADRVLVMYAGRVAEIAAVDDLYENPQHPYTVGLLGAIPRLDARGGSRLSSIPGTPPDLLIPVEHCSFAWRCVHAQDRCWQEIPELVDVQDGHKVACFGDLEGREHRNGRQ